MFKDFEINNMVAQQGGSKAAFVQNVAVGRFHVKGPRKKVNVKKWIFFIEM